jgi:SAM-dependent methyltransferase
MVIRENQTRLVGEDWKASLSPYANLYYEEGEKEEWLQAFWAPKTKFRKYFDKLDLRIIVELACGHGRHTAYVLRSPHLRHRLECIYVIDINEENVLFCQKRFFNDAFVRPTANNGYDFQPLKNNSVTSIFCYDAMVHFEYDAVIHYLTDAYRILKPGGRALLHHSNYDKSPGAVNTSNPHGRNFMNKNLFAHIANRVGFIVLEQSVIHWDTFRNLDCISLIEKSHGVNQPVLVTHKRSKFSGRIFHTLFLHLIRKAKGYFRASRQY